MPVQVLNGHDQDAIGPDLVEQCVRKAVQPATSSSSRHRGPCRRILQDTTEDAFDFRRELQPETLALKIVIRNGFCELIVSSLEEVQFHEEYFFSIFSNTMAAGTDASAPRS